MSDSPTSFRCTHCAYDLSGIAPNQDGRITCPECGITLRPTPPEDMFTTRKLHRLCYRRILLPTAIPAALLLLISWIPPLNLLLGLIAFFTLSIVGLSCLLITTTDAFVSSKIYPRQFKRWLIPFWTLLYIVPAFLLTLLYFWIASFFYLTV